jgi:hypothetical protein
MDQPARYSIEELLNSGVQPLPDLPEDELTELGKAIGKGPLADPVSLSSDGILLDGHQRLKAMLRSGRKVIAAADVRIVEAANKSNALEYAVQLNVARRHLTTDDKARLARRLRAERNWSQRKIAKLFGVSQPSVSEWFGRDLGEDAPDLDGPVIGEDGKVYDVPAPAVHREPRMRNPWAPDGYAFKSVHKARKLMAEPVGSLTMLQRARLVAELSDLAEAVEKLLSEVQAEDEG